ncbi:unnamed protein product [Ectocarpus sp. CCAP 1310/34]|nr:unnamed protein product [Ectocarpus sp. CCAP 1310/34]
MLLTPRSVCVLVCNAGEFGQQLGRDNIDQADIDCRRLEALRVCEWLRSISRRVPGNDIILLATKCDLVSGNAEETGRRMEHACRMWLSSWVCSGMGPVRLEHRVSLTSCFPVGAGEPGESSSGNDASKQGWACDWRDVERQKPSTSLLYRLVNKPDEGGLRGVRMVLPRSWDIAQVFLDSLEDGRARTRVCHERRRLIRLCFDRRLPRNPVEMVMRKSPDNDGGGATETAGGKTTVFQGITVEELKTKWQEIVDELGRSGITVANMESALEGALSIRCNIAGVRRNPRSPREIVFLDFVWLARILKPFLNHKDQVTYDGLVRLGDTGDVRITLHDQSDIASLDRLKDEGVLEPRLANAIWPSGLSEVWAKGSTPSAWGSPRHSAPVGNFPRGPPGATEKVLTRCCSLGGVQLFWQYGVLVHGGLGDFEGREIFATVLEYSSTDNELSARIFGDISTPAPWTALSYVMSAVILMLVDFPGLRWEGSLKCPQHGNAMLLANQVSPEPLV